MYNINRGLEIFSYHLDEYSLAMGLLLVCDPKINVLPRDALSSSTGERLIFDTTMRKISRAGIRCHIPIGCLSGDGVDESRQAEIMPGPQVNSIGKNVLPRPDIIQ